MKSSPLEDRMEAKTSFIIVIQRKHTQNLTQNVQD